MIITRLKKILNSTFKGTVLPVFSSQLKGMRLKVDPLMPGNLFWNNVEPEVHNVYNIFIKKGFVVMDIGANVGLHSYYISRKFENTRVYAFEPLPGNANYIREMIALNHIPNIFLTEKAVGENSGNCYFDTSSNNHQGHVTDKKEGLVVAMTTLDDFLTENKLEPDFVKIDVEGGESAVLNGFKRNIALNHPVIIVEVHNKEQAKKVADFFKPLDYALFKLLDIKKSGNKRPFILIDKDSNGDEPPKNMNGQIIVIPSKKLNEFSSFIFSE